MKDQRTLDVLLANGELRAVEKTTSKAGCLRVVTDAPGEGLFSSIGGGPWNEGGVFNPRIEGMSVEKVLVDKQAGKIRADLPDAVPVVPMAAAGRRLF